MKDTKASLARRFSSSYNILHMPYEKPKELIHDQDKLDRKSLILIKEVQKENITDLFKRNIIRQKTVKPSNTSLKEMPVVLSKNVINTVRRKSQRFASELSLGEDLNLLQSYQNYRNPELVMKTLKEFHHFSFYLKFHCVKDKDFTEVVPFLKFKYVHKDEPVYTEGNAGQFFYILIKGKVCIRNKTFKLSLYILKKKISNNPLIIHMINSVLQEDFDEIMNHYESLSSQIEKEELENKIIENLTSGLKTEEGRALIKRMSLQMYFSDYERIYFKQGECFGEWEVINRSNKPKTYKSKLFATALENSYLLVLERSQFMSYLSACVLKANLDKQDYLKESIPPVRHSKKFSEYFKRMTPIYTEKNEVIYKENTQGKNFYIVYSGMCELQRTVSNGSVAKVINVLNLEKGSIAGLELYMKKSRTYDNTFLVKEPFTILFKLNLDDYIKEDEREFKDFIINSYMIQNSFVTKALCNRWDFKTSSLHHSPGDDTTENFKSNNMHSRNKSIFTKIIIKNSSIDVKTSTNENYPPQRNIPPFDKKKNIRIRRNVNSDLIRDDLFLTGHKHKENFNLKMFKSMQASKRLSSNFRLSIPIRQRNTSQSQLNNNKSDTLLGVNGSKIKSSISDWLHMKENNRTFYRTKRFSMPLVVNLQEKN